MKNKDSVSACTANPQRLLRVFLLRLYCKPSACTSDVSLPALQTLSLYFGCCSSACTAHPQPVLRMCLRLYCTPSACISDVSPPVLHTLSLYYTYFIHSLRKIVGKVSPILVTLTFRNDSDFESSDVSLKENKPDCVNPNFNHIDY